MPLLHIHTNLQIPTARHNELLTACSRKVARVTGKPERYVMVILSNKEAMSLGGSHEPAAYLEFKSIGLRPEQCSELSGDLCDLMATQLNIEADRIYIEFSAPLGSMWGWNSGTFG